MGLPFNKIYKYIEGFTPSSLFAAGEQGAWYDPSDLTTLFQDSAGTTPVTLSPMEQPVGLMLDKSKGLALGAELVTNGDFSKGTTGWNAGAANASLTVDMGQFKVSTTTAQFARATQTIITVIGKTYKISGKASRGTAVTMARGFINIAGNPLIFSVTTNDVLFSYIFTATGTTCEIALDCDTNLANTYSLLRKDTGANFNTTNASWRLVIRAYTS